MARIATKKLSKIEAVRRGLTDLGNDAKPVELQSHIKGKFGIAMGTDHISTCKGTILKGTPTAPKTTVKALHAGWSSGSHTAHEANSLAHQVATLKAVTAVLGKDEAKKIIDLL